MAEVRWVALAEVSRPHGVRGEMRVKVYNSDSELLPSQRSVLVRRADGTESQWELESVRGADAGHLLVKIKGVDDRDAAAGFRGAKLCVRRDAFPPAEEGEFYVCDIVGARVVGPDGEIGTVEDLASYPSADALVVRLSGGGQGEIPLIADFVQEVDTEKREVQVRREALELISGVAVKRPDAN